MVYSREEINARRTRGAAHCLHAHAHRDIRIRGIDYRLYYRHVYGYKHAATRVAGIINGKEAFTPRASVIRVKSN